MLFKLNEALLEAFTRVLCCSSSGFQVEFHATSTISLF